MLKFSSIQNISSKKWLLRESKKYIKVASFYDRNNHFDESDLIYANAMSMMKLAQEQEDEKEPDVEYQTEDIDPNPINPESKGESDFVSRFGLPGYSEEEVFSGYGMGLDPANKYTTPFNSNEYNIFGFYSPKISGSIELINTFIQALSVGGSNVSISLKSLAEKYKELYENPDVRRNIESAADTALAYYYKNPLYIRLELILGNSYYIFKDNLRNGASGIDATTVKFIKDINDQKQQRSEAYNNYVNIIKDLLAQYNIPQDEDVISFFYRMYFGNRYNLDSLKNSIRDFKYNEFRFASSITSGSQDQFYKNLKVVQDAGIDFVKKFMELRGLNHITESNFDSITKFKSSRGDDFQKKSIINQKLIFPFIDKVSNLLIDLDIEQSKSLTKYDLTSIMAAFTPEDFAQKIRDGVVNLGGRYGGSSLNYVSAMFIKSKIDPEDLEYCKANNKTFNLDTEVVVLKLIADKGKEIFPFLHENWARFKFFHASDKEPPLFDYNLYFDYVVKYEDQMNNLVGCSELNKMYSFLGNDILKYNPIEISLMASSRSEWGDFFDGYFPITPEVIDKYADEADMKFVFSHPSFGYEITISKEKTENAKKFIEEQFGSRLIDNRNINYLLFCLGKIDFDLYYNIGNFVKKTQIGIPYKFKDRLKSISNRGFFIGDLIECGKTKSFGDIHKDSVASVVGNYDRDKFIQDYDKVKTSIERTPLYQHLKPGTPEYEKIFLTMMFNFRSRNRNPNSMIKLFDDIIDASIYNLRESESCRTAQLLAGNDLTSFTPKKLAEYSVLSSIVGTVIESIYFKEYQDFANFLHSKFLYDIQPENIQEYISQGVISEEEINNLYPRYFSLDSVLTQNLDHYNDLKTKFTKYFVDHYLDKSLVTYKQNANVLYQSILDIKISKEEFESILRKLFNTQESYVPIKFPSYLTSNSLMYIKNSTASNKIIESIKNATAIIQIFNKLAEPMLDLYSKKQYGKSYADLTPDKKKDAIHDLANTLPDNINQEMVGFGQYFINNYSQSNKIKLKLIGNTWSSYINIFDENNKIIGEYLVRELAGQHNIDELFKKIKLSSMAELIEDVDPKNDDFLLEFVNHYGPGSDDNYSTEEQKLIYSTTEKVYIEGLSVPLPDWASFDKTLKKDKRNKIRLRFLPRTDTRGMFIGQYAECCQHPTSYAASCAFDGQANPNSAFMSIELNDEWIGAGYVWTNSEGGLCIDSIETVGNELFHSTTNKELFKKLLIDFSNSLGDRVLTMGHGKVNFDTFENDNYPLLNSDRFVIKNYENYLTDFTPDNTSEMYTDAETQRIVPKNL